MSKNTNETKPDKATEETTGSNRSKVLPCTCAHEYQDQRYGKNQRVHTRGGKSGAYFWTCTVCGAKK